MVDLRKDLELVEVVYENKGKKAVMKFLDIDKGELLEVNFNKQVWANGEFVDDKEKEEKVEAWSKEYFDRDFDSLSERVGDKFDVYKYKKFNSLWESNEFEKFSKEQKGMIFTTKIEEVKDTGTRISIVYKIDGDLYETKMQYAEYVESLKSWYENPQKKDRQYKKFQDKFGLPVERAEEIVGKDIMVEVEVAFGKFAYGEIKNPLWARSDK